MAGNDGDFTGKNTWSHVDFTNILGEPKTDRIVALTFPEQDKNLGLEPSILSVLPEGDNVEYSLKNVDFPDGEVQYYLCSVYITGMDEFLDWASRHDVKKIVVGGYHPTTFPEEFTNYAFKIVRGIADDFWATIHQEGQIVTGVVSNKNLPRYDLYDMSWNQQIIPDKKPDDLCTSIYTSQGCPFKCDFCCSPIMCSKIVSRPLDIIQKEVDYLKLQNPKFIFIRDENFPLQTDWRERLQIIKQTGAKIYLFASANTLSEENIIFMKENGVYMICLGLEDISVDYTKNKQLDEVCKLLRKHGIYIYLSFIVNPLKIVGRENGEDFYNRLLDRFYQLKPDMVCGNFLMPFRGTKLWDEYYHLVDRSDYKYYDSKTPFLVRNKVVQEKMKFFMFYFQWLYYTSDFYSENVRKFDVEDTLYLRFKELFEQFRPVYDRYWNVRA